MMGVPLDVRIALLRQHGTFAQAYSATFQQELEHFGDKHGFLAYKKLWGTTLVLADPIAPLLANGQLINRFLGQHDDVCFWYASRRVAEILAPLGFFINEMGPENRIDLARYDFSGRAKRNVRRSFHRMVNRGYTICESSIQEVGVAEVKAVSEAWRGTHTVSGHEVTFLCRPLVFTDDPDVRLVFAFDRHKRLTAFTVFEPVYRNGDIVGYAAQHNRRHPKADSLVQHAIKRWAIERFRAEGKQYLFLGISPMADIHDREFRKNWLVRRSFRFAYESALFNRFIYPIKSISEHKRQFHASTEQTYFAFNRLPSLPHLLRILRACRIL
jgi:lysylphosphatidylglycerol synthetase-like protein (DUF2156 family)